MSADVKRQAFQAVGASAGAPAGFVGSIIGADIGKELGVAVLGPAAKVGTQALTRGMTEEEIKDKRAKEARKASIELAQDRPGKAQTALTDMTSQSAFPFRLY